MLEAALEEDEYKSLEGRVRRLEALSQEGASVLPDTVLDEIKSGENPVRVVRRYRLLTQRELSELTGLSENHISNIENGAQFNLRTAKKLAAALEVKIDDIA